MSYSDDELRDMIMVLEKRIEQLEKEVQQLKQKQQPIDAVSKVIYHRHSWEPGAGGYPGYPFTTRPAAEGFMGWSTIQGNTSPIQVT